jgi:hypothetical protein
VRGTITLALALAGVAAIPAAAGAATQKGSVYRVLEASGNQRVSFRADPATCARFLTCGHRGTVTYKFSGKARGKLVLVQDGRGHVKGTASFRSHGTTVSDVTAGDVCSDRVSHRTEFFSLNSRSRLGSLVFGFHGGKTDYLETDCAGPTEAALKHDRALPSGMFKRKHFNSPRTQFGIKGSSVFREKGYQGTASFKLRYSIRRDRCSPNCVLP